MLLSNFSPEERDRLLSGEESFRKLSAREQQAVKEQLAEIKAQGYHCAASDITIGVTDCAVFAGTASSGLMAAVAVSSLTTSLGKSHDQDTIVQALKETAAHINRRLGIAP